MPQEMQLQKPQSLFEYLKQWADYYFEKKTPVPHTLDYNGRSMLVEDDVNIFLDFKDGRKAVLGEPIKLKEIVEYITSIIEHPLMHKKPWGIFSGLMIAGLFTMGYIFEDKYTTKKLTIFNTTFYFPRTKLSNGIKWASPMILLTFSVYFSFIRE